MRIILLRLVFNTVDNLIIIFSCVSVIAYAFECKDREVVSIDLNRSEFMYLNTECACDHNYICHVFHSLFKYTYISNQHHKLLAG